jgi:hypothetical protein
MKNNFAPEINNQSQHIIKMQQRFLDEKDERKRKEIMKRIEEIQKKEKKKFRETIISTTALMVQRKVKIVNLIMSFLVISNVAVSLFENSIFIDPRYAKDSDGNIIIENGEKKIEKPEYTADSLVTSMKWLNVGIVVLMELILFYRYTLDIKYLRKLRHAGKNDNLITTGLWKNLLLEFSILAIISPPHTTHILEGKMLFGNFAYASDSIILVFVFPKLYYLSNIYQDFSLWVTKPVQSIARQFNIKVGFSFAFKAQMKEYPILTIAFILMFSVSMLMIMIRVFEYGYSDDNELSSSKGIINSRFKSYADNFWLVIISMMTIGYGDMAPNTHFGRGLIFIASIVGMLIVSLLIVTLSFMVEFSREEQKAYSIILNKESNREKKVRSVLLIMSIMQLFKIKKYGQSHKYKTRYVINNIGCFYSWNLYSK